MTDGMVAVVKHLGQEQQIQSKLREALFHAYPDARANNEQPKLDAILKTKVAYLDAFIEEVLRSSNPSMVVSKDADEDLTIFGHHIPRGTMVLFTSYGPTITHGGARVDESLRSESSQKHREEGLGDWADSEYPGEEFHPERWLRLSDDGTGELVFDAKAGPILTFSAGPRMCWGRRLAYLELKLVVTLFVWNFVFERLPDHLHDWDVDDDLFIKPKHSRVRLGSVPPAEKVR
jgi:cytochrome P450